MSLGSSYHVQTNVSVERGIIQGICVHSTQKGDGLFPSNV